MCLAAPLTHKNKQSVDQQPSRLLQEQLLNLEDSAVPPIIFPIKPKLQAELETVQFNIIVAKAKAHPNPGHALEPKA